MGTLVNSAGAVRTKAGLPKTEVTTATRYTVDEDVYERFTHDGTDGETGRRLKWRAGQTISDEEFNAAFPMISGVSPASGPAAGGTVVTVSGTNFLAATGVTLGGVAGTAFDVVDDTTIRATTGAHAAGEVDVVVAHPSGNVTRTGGFTYT